MKHKLGVIAASLLLQFQALHAEIIETPHFSDITKYANEETLLLIDIDDTLLITKQMLGCDEWFKLRLDHHLEQMGEFRPALEKALAEWEGIRHYSEMEIVEEGTESVIEALQKGGFPMMGLTTQGLALATRTSQQLAKVGIDLKKSAPADKDVYLLQEGHGVLYRNGILFTSGTKKGESFVKLMDAIGADFKRVVFINDKDTHLADLEKSAEERGIEFIGLRYAYSDAKKAAFDPEIAQIQFEKSSFSHLLSDEEAKQYKLTQYADCD